jgi:hypothetical protein
VDVGTGEDKFEVNVDGTYYPNGVADGVLPVSIGGQASYTIVTDNNDDCFPGGTRCAASTNFDITSDVDGSPMHRQIITVKANRGMVHVYSQMSKENAFGCVGMMGNGPGMLLGRDGTIISNADEFGMEWQVQPDEDGGLFLNMRAPQYSDQQQCTVFARAPAPHRVRSSSISTSISHITT